MSLTINTDPDLLYCYLFWNRGCCCFDVVIEFSIFTSWERCTDYVTFGLRPQVRLKCSPAKTYHSTGDGPKCSDNFVLSPVKAVYNHFIKGCLILGLWRTVLLPALLSYSMLNCPLLIPRKYLIHVGSLSVLAFDISIDLERLAATAARCLQATEYLNFPGNSPTAKEFCFAYNSLESWCKEKINVVFLP